MHALNPHSGRYDFPKLIQSLPELKAHVLINKYGDQSINFDDPVAVRALNRAILKFFYGINFWEIPEAFLCPPIPGRADYLHYLADLFPNKKALRGLDIGVGANCIYPLIGVKAFGWQFIGSDIEKDALKSAAMIVQKNDLDKNIQLRLQIDKSKIFKNIIEQDEHFDFTICNPPFHASEAEARAGTLRKRKNLGFKDTSKLNFGGKSNELWCEGGEQAFIGQMIQESLEFKQSVTWFSTLVSKEANVAGLSKQLKKIGSEFKVMEMNQGQKISRLLAWKF